LCNILITIKVHTLVKTNRYMKMHGETIKIIKELLCLEVHCREPELVICEDVATPSTLPLLPKCCFCDTLQFV
jgi:hypothetical protein